jgi:class 3 adenylate cyclase
MRTTVVRTNGNLSGRILRGAVERINAVLWFSDLKGYTTIADSAAPERVIPLLNDYAEVVISAVDEGGGDILKLIGDEAIPERSRWRTDGAGPPSSATGWR